MASVIGSRRCSVRKGLGVAAESRDPTPKT
jgi:hypothetical protein